VSAFDVVEAYFFGDLAQAYGELRSFQCPDVTSDLAAILRSRRCFCGAAASTAGNIKLD
jgi:hypothetical protein